MREPDEVLARTTSLGPEEAHGNDLISDPPRYWEVALSASRAGLDYDERFLLPVYA